MRRWLLGAPVGVGCTGRVAHCRHGQVYLCAQGRCPRTGGRGRVCRGSVPRAVARARIRATDADATRWRRRPRLRAMTAAAALDPRCDGLSTRSRMCSGLQRGRAPPGATECSAHRRRCKPHPSSSSGVVAGVTGLRAKHVVGWSSRDPSSQFPPVHLNAACLPHHTLVIRSRKSTTKDGRLPTSRTGDAAEEGYGGTTSFSAVAGC